MCVVVIGDIVVIIDFGMFECFIIEGDYWIFYIVLRFGDWLGCWIGVWEGKFVIDIDCVFDCVGRKVGL